MDTGSKLLEIFISLRKESRDDILLDSFSREANVFVLVSNAIANLLRGSAFSFSKEIRASSSLSLISAENNCSTIEQFCINSNVLQTFSDARILNSGTAYQTDAGMCGDYNSVIGMDKNKALERYKKKTPIKGIHPATGEATLSCVYVDLDDKTGLAKSIKQIIKGGSLEEIS